MTDTMDFQQIRERAATAYRPQYGAGGEIICDNLVKIYKVANLEVVALQGLDLVVEQGEFIAIVGASGSGKSTLLNILGGLDIPSAGKALVGGNDLLNMNSNERTLYRRQVIGFVWQQTGRNLLPYLNAIENVEMPMIFEGAPRKLRKDRARELLDLVGLAERGHHRPNQLSGGEQQRVAIAVALANAPQVLLADEPTGELDTSTSNEIFDVLRSVSEEQGVTVIVVTHDPLVSERVNRTVSIRDGRTSSETVRRSEMGEHGDHQIIAEEFAVLDRAGRLQLPTDYVESLHLERRVRLALENDHIGVWPDHDNNGRNGGDEWSSDERWRPPSTTGRRDAFATQDADSRAVRTWTRPSERTVAANTPIVEVEGITRDYPVGDSVVHALRGLDFSIQRGQLVAIQGRSGSGKTSLLNIIGGLDSPTEGKVWINGQDVTAMQEENLVELRRKNVGFIFQAFGLIPILTAAENVEIPLRMISAPVAERDERVRLLLEMVGLGERASHRPHELSGGEQQRVAIARALANGPQLLLADEPTGQLDSRTGRTIMDLDTGACPVRRRDGHCRDSRSGPDRHCRPPNRASRRHRRLRQRHRGGNHSLIRRPRDRSEARQQPQGRRLDRMPARCLRRDHSRLALSPTLSPLDVCQRCGERRQIILMSAHNGQSPYPREPSEVRRCNPCKLARGNRMLNIDYPPADLWNTDGPTASFFQQYQPRCQCLYCYVKLHRSTRHRRGDAVGNRSHARFSEASPGSQIGNSLRKWPLLP